MLWCSTVLLLLLLVLSVVLHDLQFRVVLIWCRSLVHLRKQVSASFPFKLPSDWLPLTNSFEEQVSTDITQSQE